jgi:nucleoside-diphosphate-sugar epimerase
MKKVIITGISGFVGQNLSKYLSGFYDVIGVGRNERVNYENFSKINYDAIIHLAGKAHDLKNVAKPDEYYQVNFELTRKIYDSFLASQAQTFIFISSVKAVADEVDGVLVESSTPNPQTHYGKSKLLAENYILENIKPNKRVIILRPCIIHGEGNKGNLNLLFNIVKKGIPYPLGAFENRRSFLTITNLCFVIKEILDNENIISEVFNVSDDDAISTNELIALINIALGKQVSILRIPKKIILAIAKIGDIFKLPLTTEKLNKLTDNYVVSNKKVLTFINKKLPYSTKNGLLKTFSTYK